MVQRCAHGNTTVDLSGLLCADIWRGIVSTRGKMYWWSSGSGRIELKIPAEAIVECSHPGPCDGDVAYWAPRLGLDAIERKVIERELKEYGAWDDLETVDIKTLYERLAWVACGDLHDTPDNELEEVIE